MMLTKTQERVYSRRYVKMGKAMDKLIETVGTMIAGVGIAWIMLNALFPNTPLQ